MLLVLLLTRRRQCFPQVRAGLDMEYAQHIQTCIRLQNPIGSDLSAICGTQLWGGIRPTSFTDYIWAHALPEVPGLCESLVHLDSWGK